MELHDLSAVRALSAQLGYVVTEDELRARFLRLRNERGLFVCIVEDALAGWIDVHERWLLEAPPHGELGGLVVDERMRRRGVGRALVMRAIAWTRSRGLSLLRLRSNVARDAAHAFYPALGFARIRTSHVYEISC